MTVVISDSSNPAYTGRLSASGGFYRVEAANLRAIGNVLLMSTSGITIPVTFANAGNCKGLVVELLTSAAVSVASTTVTVNLQENVSGTWTTRATKSLAYSDISITSPTQASGSMGLQNWIVPFAFSTPYAVDTTASKWRFQVLPSVSSAYYTATSDNTNPFYAAWCGNAVSFASTDALIVKDPVSVDADVTFRGVYGTGSTADSTCVVLCRNSTADPASVCNLTVDVTAQRNITFDGICRLSGYSGLRAGTLASPVSIANRCVITYQAYMTNGTNSVSRWVSGPATYRGKSSIYMYGERPSVPYCTLAADVAVGATSLTLNETPTGWSVGDKICIGKADAQGSSTSVTEYTVSSIAGKSLGFSPAVATVKKVSGGHVVNQSLTYGITWTVSNTTYDTDQSINMCNAAVFDGCKMINQTFRLNNQSSTTSPDLAARCDKVAFRRCLINQRLSPTGMIFGVGHNHWMGTEISNCVWLGANYATTFVPMQAHYNGGLGICSTTDNVILGLNKYMILPSGAGYVIGAVFSRNIVENIQPYNMQYPFFGVNFAMEDNSIWGASVPSAVLGAATQLRCPFDIAEWVGGSFKRNKFNKCHIALEISGVMSGVDADGNEFGLESSNSEDLAFKEAAFVDAAWKNTRFASGVFGIDAVEQKLIQANAALRLSNYNATQDDYRAWFRRGRTYNPSQGETLRQLSSRADESFQNDYLISTKALTGYPISVFLTAQINNAGYYAGAHTLPIVSLLYDNGAEETQSLSASTDVQAVQLDVTLTTDYNDLSLRFATATDAADANAGVDFSSVVLKMRKYGKLFVEYDLTIKQTTGGYVAGLTVPQNNPFTTEVSEVAVAAYAGISLNGITKTITVSAAHTLAELYDYSQYWATQNIEYDPAITTLDGTTLTLASGWKLAGISYLTAGAKRLAGTVVLSAPGSYDMTLGVATLEFSGAGAYSIYESTLYETITLVNTSGGAVTVEVLPGTSYVNSGPSITVTEYIAPTYATGSITGLAAGTRLQVYNVTTSTEMVNAINPGTTYTTSYLNGTGYTGGDIVRIRAIKVDGATATEFVEAQTIAASGGWSFLISQGDDAVYNTNGVVGADVTNVVIDDATLLVSVSTGSITWQELYAYETDWLFSAAGIRDEGRFTEAKDVANYVWHGFKIKNITTPSVPLVISGGYGVDGVTGASIDLIDATGGTIIMAPDHVVAKVVTVTGGNVVTGDISDVPALVLAAAQTAPISADVTQVRGQTLKGTGVSSDPWGPA